ncbi:unnamed protein product [Soboliphyme baturini]|uniref:MFS domain-containing protein n=1 Tax=Soboliphyme baturini TaxID=241478 RepID=A0A183J8T5_9BILA|nr:unnamed protein product [Soboliphyme baturini]
MMSIASTDWRAFAIFQFFNGYIFGHMKTTCITLLIETTDGKYRLVPFACIQWGLGFMINSIVLYLANDWRMFIVIVNLISSPLIYFYLLFQESYRWLLARGDLRGAADVMTELNSERWAKGDRENNVDGEITSEQLIMLLPDNESKRNFHSCFYLFLEKSTCRTTIVLMLMMVTYGMVGSWFHSGNDAISVDINIHFLLHGALTFWISSVIVLLDLKVPKLGYKPQLLFGMSLLAVCFAVTLFFNVTSYQAPRHIIYIATSIAAITDSSIVLMMICHTTAAVYPTVVRSKAFGLLFACENLGSIIMTILLSDYFSNGPVVGHFTCEALVIGAVLLAILYFPETKFMITREFLIDVFPTYNSNIGQS